MKIKKFGVYLADLSPQFGTEAGKTRPVVVVQTDMLNNEHPSTIICPITTNVKKASSILRVHLLEKDCGLKKNSDVLVDQVRAIDNRRFTKSLGILSNRQQEMLVNNLKILLLE